MFGKSPPLLIEEIADFVREWALLRGHAQQPVIPMIEFLHSASAGPFAHLVTSRWNSAGRNRYELLPALAADLFSRRPAVIAVAGGEPEALAAKVATETIPIAFNTGGDRVRQASPSSRTGRATTSRP